MPEPFPVFLGWYITGEDATIAWNPPLGAASRLGFPLITPVKLLKVGPPRFENQILIFFANKVGTAERPETAQVPLEPQARINGVQSIAQKPVEEWICSSHRTKRQRLEQQKSGHDPCSCVLSR